MTDIQNEIDRLVDLRQRALDGGLDETTRDRFLIRQLDKKIADAYGKRAAKMFPVRH